MKVLVCTNKLQGERKSDFSFTNEGELAYFGFECDTDKRTGPDGGCGCRRAFSGMDSHLAGTTAEVVEKDMTPEQFIAHHYEAHRKNGWVKLMGDTAETRELFKADAEELLRIAASFQTGVVVEKRGDVIQVRGQHQWIIRR